MKKRKCISKQLFWSVWDVDTNQYTGYLPQPLVVGGIPYTQHQATEEIPWILSNKKDL